MDTMSRERIKATLRPIIRKVLAYRLPAPKRRKRARKRQKAKK